MHFPWLISLHPPDIGISRISRIYLRDLSDARGTGASTGESCDAKTNTLSSRSKQAGCMPGCGCCAHSGSRGITVRETDHSASSLLRSTFEWERVSARGLRRGAALVCTFQTCDPYGRQPFIILINDSASM